jgi:hypothetical protein
LNDSQLRVKKYINETLQAEQVQRAEYKRLKAIKKVKKLTVNRQNTFTLRAEVLKLIKKSHKKA